MDQSDTDWGGWNTRDSMDGDSFSRREDSNLSMGDTKSDSVYDGSNIGNDDEYSNMYDDYNDDYQDGSDTEDDDDDENERPYTSTPQSMPFKFINGKDGMATCEKCGAVGIKHAFYSKSKRFCSLSCSRSFATSQREGKQSPTGKGDGVTSPLPPKKPAAKKLANQAHLQRPVDNVPRTLTKREGGLKGFDWGPYLSSGGAEAAPVSYFKHCPMYDSWHNITTGMKLEVINFECDLSSDAFWIATVIKIGGYKALMRYEGYANDPSHDFWVNLCTDEVHPVGWCATSGKPLVPPKYIQNKYVDWKEYLVKRLTGSRTLPNNFYNKVVESINSHGFKYHMQVEVVDKMCVSAMRVARVEEIIGGRLRLQYSDTKEEDDFWCHCRSSLVHPIAWSQQTGHKLHATTDYRNKCLNKIAVEKYDANDATPSLFFKMKEPPNGLKFQVGMKLEAIDPLNLSAICVATVMKVLKNNYLMIGIDGSMAENGSDWFCYHATSPCIFPVGFCKINGLDLTPPRGHKGPFKWFDYLKQTKSLAAPVKLFDKDIPKHGFKSGMKIEAVDLMEPRLICVGTVLQVVGRLLRVHFDGWENEYDQWVDCESPDMYPVGWCEVMDYSLEGPRVKVEQVQQIMPTHKMSKEQKKRKGKTQIYKGPRKKRKTKMGSPLADQQQRSLQENNRDQGFLSYGSRTRPAHHSLPPLVDPVVTTVLKGSQEIETSDTSTNDGPPQLSPHSITESQLRPSSQTPRHTDSHTKSTLQPYVKQEPMDISDNLSNQSNTSISSSPNGKTALSNLLMSKTTNQVKIVTPASSQGNEQMSLLAARQSTVSPDQWSVSDVCYFLKSHDCALYCESFVKMGIDGQRLLSLSKEQIASITGMKVGASLKISELVQQLKSRCSKLNV